MSSVLSESRTSRSEVDTRINSTQDYENQYVSFWLDGQLIGVPVIAVQEVLNPQNIARPPRARKEIAGLLNLRGQIVTAVDLRRRLGLPPNPSEEGSMNVVVQHNDEPFSFLVDEVGEVINVSHDLLKPVPPTLDNHWQAVTAGVFWLEEHLLVVLNVAAVLNMK